MNTTEPSKYRKLSWGVAIVGLILSALFAVNVVFLRSKNPLTSFSARTVDGPLSFVVFVSRLEDARNPESRSVFGWGGSARVSEAALQLAGEIHNCRQYKIAGDVPLQLDVKIDLKRPGFKVVGLLAGADKNPAMSMCVRDKINAAPSPVLADLKAVEDDLYRLVLEVHSNVGAALPNLSEQPELVK